MEWAGEPTRQLKALHQNGHSLAEIAEALGVTRSAVWHALVRNGFQVEKKKKEKPRDFDDTAHSKMKMKNKNACAALLDRLRRFHPLYEPAQPEEIVDVIAPTIIEEPISKKDNSNSLFRELLSDLPSAGVVSITSIKRLVANHFNIRVSDLESARRDHIVVRPRQIAMYLSKTMTKKSLPEIGRRFGGRDHTTALHAVRKVEGLMAERSDFAATVNEIRGVLQ